MAIEGATVRCCYRWLADDDTLVATEQRAITFGGVDDARTIDVEVVLHAGDAPLVFGDSKEGTFAVRVRPELRVEGKVATGVLQDSAGRRDKDVWGKRANWIDDSGVVAGKALGVAMFDHPDNLRHPTYWHARTYGLLAANPFGVKEFTGDAKADGAYAVPAGGELRLRYRVLLHGGGWSKARLDAAYAGWAAR